MAKIKGVVRTVAQPGSLGQARGSTSLYEPIAQGVQELGGAIDLAAQRIEEKKQLASITQMDSDFRKWSRERLMDDQQNRQGEAALGDDETPDVYKSYDDDAEKRVGEMVAKISPRYQEEARKRFAGVADGYRNTYAGYLVQQQGVHRKAVIADSINTSVIELTHNMESPTASIEDIIRAKGEIKAAAETNSGGQNVEAYVQAQTSVAAKQAILAKSGKNALAAKEILDDERMTDLLDPAERESLEVAIEKDRVEQGAEALVATVSGLELEDQITAIGKVAKDKPGDADIAKAAMAEVKFIAQADKEAKSLSQRDRFDTVWDDMRNKNKVYTPMEIYADEEMSIEQRESLVRMLGGDGKVGEMDVVNRNNAYFQALQHIRKKDPGWTTQAEIQAQQGIAYDVRDTKKLAGIEFEDNLEGTGLTTTVQLEVDALYPEVDQNVRRAAIIDITENLRAQFQESGFPATPLERTNAIKSALTPARDKTLYEKVPFVSDEERAIKTPAELIPVSEEEERIPPKHRAIVSDANKDLGTFSKPIPYATAVTDYWKGQGYPDAFHSVENGTDVFVLGFKDGKYGYDVGDGAQWLDPADPKHQQMIAELELRRAL